MHRIFLGQTWKQHLRSCFCFGASTRTLRPSFGCYLLVATMDTTQTPSRRLSRRAASGLLVEVSNIHWQRKAMWKELHRLWRTCVAELGSYFPRVVLVVKFSSECQSVTFTNTTPLRNEPHPLLFMIMTSIPIHVSASIHFRTNCDCTQPFKPQMHTTDNKHTPTSRHQHANLLSLPTLWIFSLAPLMRSEDH